MILLAILMSICVERLINPGLFLHRFAWFSRYLGYLQTKLTLPLLWRSLLGFAVGILPLLLLTAILYYGLGFINPMAKELVAILVLIYCLGPGDTRRQLEGYIAAIDEKDGERIEHYTQLLVPAASTTELEQAIVERAVLSFNDEVFAVLFWFALLGPMGALLYRFSQQFTEHCHPDVSAKAYTIKGLLDWLPIRLLGISFTLVGRFTASFNFICRKLLSRISYNRVFLNNIALIAIGVDPAVNSQASAIECKALLGLFDRTLVIWLVAIALFTLGAWAY